MIAELIIYIIVFGTVIALIVTAITKCCKFSKYIQEHDAKNIAAAIVLMLLVFWPVALGEVVYLALKWNEKITDAKTNPQKPYKDDYERWKEQRLIEQENNRKTDEY